MSNEPFNMIDFAHDVLAAQHPMDRPATCQNQAAPDPVQDVLARKYGKALARIARLEACLRDVLDELDARYDGCPDSTTHWMAEHIDAIRKLVAERDGVTR